MQKVRLSRAELAYSLLSKGFYFNHLIILYKKTFLWLDIYMLNVTLSRDKGGGGGGGGRGSWLASNWARFNEPGTVMALLHQVLRERKKQSRS
jgi:hypothetical protein